MSEYDTADMKNLHYHAFNYRNAHSTQAGNDFNTLEKFVSNMCIAAGDRWRDEWSDACNDNQGLVNNIATHKRWIEKLVVEGKTLRTALVKCCDGDQDKAAELVEHADIVQPVQPADRHIKLVPIRQLFDGHGDQVCDTGAETCHFYVPERLPNYIASCNHCQRGIPNNKPHRLCPVLS